MAKDCQFLKYNDGQGNLTIPPCHWVKDDSEEPPCVPCLLNLCLIELQAMHQHIDSLEEKFIKVDFGRMPLR